MRDSLETGQIGLIYTVQVTRVPYLSVARVVARDVDE